MSSGSWFGWFAVSISRIEFDGVWPDCLLDAYISMLPKVDQRPPCVFFQSTYIYLWLMLSKSFDTSDGGGERGRGILVSFLDFWVCL